MYSTYIDVGTYSSTVEPFILVSAYLYSLGTIKVMLIIGILI